MALDLSATEHAALLAAFSGPALAISDEPSMASGSPGPKLPLPRTPLIGRSRDVRVLSKLVRVGASQIITLTGVGGTGKTRLALAVAAEVGDAYPGGVSFVDLAAIADPSFIANAIAAALGVRETASRPLIEGLKARLQQTETLLILDNCEHLIDGCIDMVEGLTAACPRLQILATSRQPLQVSGEKVWRVSPLELPDIEAPDLLAAAKSSPAVRLFCERAQAASATFRLTEANASAVVRICFRLDGIPLVLELAAAWMRVLSAEQLLQRLDDALSLLVTNNRTSPTRQRTLRAALDWSYNLLADAERAVFRRLAIFVGSFDLAAAEAVCADDGLEVCGVLDMLARLVDKSLVIAEVDSETARYRLPEPMRQFGEQCSTVEAEWESTRQRHAAHYLSFAQKAARALDGPSQANGLELLERERNNLRAALSRALQANDVETGLRLAGVMVPFWEIRGYLLEGRRWLGALVASAEACNVTPQVRASALLGAGRLANWQQDDQEAARLCEQALSLYRELGHRPGIAEAQVWLSVTYRNRGDLEEARPLVEDTLSLYQELGDESGVAEALRNLSIIARREGETGRAIALAEESLARFEKLGDERHIARGRTQLALAVLQHGDAPRAKVLFSEALQGHSRVRDSWFMANALVGLATAYAAEGQEEQAARLLGAGEALHETLSVPLSLSSGSAYEQLLARVRGALGPTAFLAAWQEGRASMTIAHGRLTGKSPVQDSWEISHVR